MKRHRVSVYDFMDDVARGYWSLPRDGGERGWAEDISSEIFNAPIRAANTIIKFVRRMMNPYWRQQRRARFVSLNVNRHAGFHMHPDGLHP